MRPIKFRAWDLVTEELYYVNMVDFKNNHIQLQDDDGTITAMLDEVELMQYTGLKDKNGKEIYKGDIVTDGNRIGKVQHSTKEARFEVFYGYGSIDGIMNWWANEILEVIGNTYENPELLEGSQ